ncbi:MAG: response regulator, partial [Chitinophagia bacterium]|nr:response regulator [Chitinophagia bacterium]
IQQLIAYRKPAAGDKLQFKDGRVVERSYFPVVIEGTLKGHLWIYNEEIDLNKLEKTVNAKIDKYRNVIANMNLGLMEVDANDKIVSVNETFCYMSGYAREELFGKKILDVLGNKKNEKEIKDRINLRKHGFIDMYQLPVLNKQGNERWWLMSDAPIFDENGELVGSIGIHMDISDQKKMEQELEVSRQKAEDSSKAKETFLANMSHEIRTPMTGILGIVNILSKTSLDEQQQKFVHMISESANNLLTIINDVLDIEKITAGKLDLEHIPFKIEEKVFNVLQSFQYKAEDKNINLVLNSSLPDELIVVGDPYRLGQILNNLLGNAIKFTSQGEIAISIQIKQADTQKTTIEIKVQDSGIGIKEDRLNEIFQPFVQAATDTSRKYGGTGLGLTICKNLIEMQGGQIWVQSKVGVGTTFGFHIPYTKGNDSMIPVVDKESINFKELAGISILVAEDVALNQFLIKHILDSWSCESHIVNNGKEAVEAAQKKAFDLILMDIHMPEMDGKEATSLIRKLNIGDRYSQSNPQAEKNLIPIIALTAHALKGDGQRYINMGMNGYIAKPYTEEKLYQAIKEILRPETLQQAASQNAGSEPAPPPKPAAIPPANAGLLYDLSFINSVGKDDPAFIEKILTIFLETMPADLNKLIDAYNKRSVRDVADLAHKMKSMIDTLGISSIKDVIRELEATQAIVPETPQKIVKVKDTLQQVFKQLKEIV